MVSHMVSWSFLILLVPAMAGLAAADVRWSSAALRVPPDGPPEMVAVPAYPRLPLKRPVFLERQPGSDRILVIENYAWEEYRSVIRRFRDDPEASEVEDVLVIPGDGELAYGLCFALLLGYILSDVIDLDQAGMDREPW